VYDFFLHLWRLDGDVRAALDFLCSFKAYASPDSHTFDSNRSGEEFAAGRAGLMVNWAGYAAMAAGRVDFACRLAPSTTVNAFWATVITSSCATPDAAWAYVDHASSAESDRQTTLAGASGARLSTWRDRRILQAHPEYALFEAAHQNSRPLPRIPTLPALVDSLNELVDTVVWREEPAGPAVAAAQSTLEGLR
jgi:multiple sugar transport system substrate-binding protein